MGMVEVTAERMIEAPAEAVYGYLADLKEQYGDAPGLSMVSDVLTTLSHHGQPAARPGSARDPDPDY